MGILATDNRAQKGDRVFFKRKEKMARGIVIDVRSETALVQLEPCVMCDLALTTDLTVVRHGRYIVS